MRFHKLGKFLSIAAAAAMATSCATATRRIILEHQTAREVVSQEIAQAPSEADKDIHIADSERPDYLQRLPPKQEIEEMTPLEKIIQENIEFLIDFKKGEFDSTMIITNKSAKADLNINGQNVRLILPLYKVEKDGSWTYVIDNTKVNKEAIIKDLTKVLEDGVELAYGFYKDLSAFANWKINSEIFKDAKKDKARKIEGTNLTYADAFGWLDLQKQDFLPDGAKIWFGPLEAGVLAATWLDDNKMVYTPTARRIDEIWGRAYIVAHELTHNNSKLQGLPVPLAHDVEFQAFQINLLSRGNALEYLTHPYGKDIRRLGKTYFGLDAEKAIKSIVDMDNTVYAYVELNEGEWKKAVVQVAGVTAKMQSAIKNQAFPEYYAFMPWWLIANNYLKNPIAPMETVMARDKTPMIMPKDEYEKFIKDKKATIDAIVNKVIAEYKMPRLVDYGFFIGLSGLPFREVVMQECRAMDLNEQQSEVVYHFAMKEKMLNDGKIDYGMLTVKEALDSLAEINGIFVPVVSKWGLDKNKDVMRRVELYSWLENRLCTANRYIDFAKQYGSIPDEAFTPKVFDPRVSLEGLYNYKPEFIKKANAKNLVATTRIDTDGDGAIDTVIKQYNIVKKIGFKENGADYIAVFRIGETKPFMIAYPSAKSKVPDMAVSDTDSKGMPGYGEYDKLDKINSIADIRKLLEKPLLPNL